MTGSVDRAEPVERLTKREQAALRAFNVEGELSEGIMSNLWPTIRNARLVTNSLMRKGLVSLGEWWGEDAGYELVLTPAGLEAASQLAELDA